jgi:hypothetical protein
MTMLKGKCDLCNLVFDSEELYNHYDGIHYCERCDLKVIIRELEEDIRELRIWLKDTHIKKLRDMRKRLAAYKEKLIKEENNA